MRVEADLLNSIRFECLSKKTLYAAIDIFIDRLQFASRFSIHGRFDTTNEGLREIEEFCRHVALDGYSIVAINKKNNRVIGVIFNKLEVLFQNENLNFYLNYIKVLKNEWLKCWMVSMMKMQNISNLRKRFNIFCYLNIIATATILEYENSILSSLLVKSTVAFCEEERDIMIKSLMLTTNFNFPPILPDMVFALAPSEPAKQYFLHQQFLSMHIFSYNELGLNVSNICQPVEQLPQNAFLMTRWIINSQLYHWLSNS